MKSYSLRNVAQMLLTLLITGGLISCGGGKKEETTESSEFDEAATEVQQKVEKVIYEIPSPSDIPFIIESTGAEYNDDLVNDISKVDKYLTSNKIAALNLGIYATDIGYFVTYDQVQEALNYMDGCQRIAEQLGIQNVADATVIQRFEDNLQSRDSLGGIINQIIANSDTYLRESERNNIAALVLAGTFIEGLYISTQLVATYPKDLLPDDSRILILTPVIHLILDQEEALGDMIDLLKNINIKGDWIEGLINSLVELQGNYQELDIKEQLSQNRPDLVLTDVTLERITKQIDRIRTTMTY
ncbi:hypothetical protein ACFLU5_00390 [Bacteroidota bacterium]